MKIIKLNNSNFDKNNIVNLLKKNTCFIGIFNKFCIHCENMKPEWIILKKKLKKIKCNEILLEIDSEKLKYIDYSPLTNTINGYPSILLFKNGKKFKEYKGNRTSNDMFNFLKPHLRIVNNKTKKKSGNNRVSRKSKTRSHRK